MPDKKRYVEEMVRVLKPGGTLVVATWCQRDDRAGNTRRILFVAQTFSHDMLLSSAIHPR
jgi:MPBQ/MSBQ methyltransferase